MGNGVNPNGERGLVSDIAQKYFGEMDVENLLAGQVMERTLGVSKAQQDNVRGSLVSNGGLSNLGGALSSMKGTMGTYGSKVGSGL